MMIIMIIIIMLIMIIIIVQALKRFAAAHGPQWVKKCSKKMQKCFQKVENISFYEK